MPPLGTAAGSTPDAGPTAAAVRQTRSRREAAAEWAVVWLQRRLDGNRLAGLGLLRRRWPVLRLGSFVVVTRRDDVLEVLGDPDTFGLPYAPKLSGTFLLGLTGADHGAALEELHQVFLEEDGDRVEQLVLAASTARVDAALTAGSMDVGRDLVHPVLNEVVGEYLGTPGPDLQTQLRWARALFQDIFLNPTNLPSVQVRASVAWDEMADHVDSVLAGRDPAHGPDDVAQRLLRRHAAGVGGAFDPATIRDNLIGLGIGWLWHGAKAGITAVDALLDRPEALREAVAASRAGDLGHLRGVLYETLRFRPVQAGLPRVCAGGTTLVTPDGRPVEVKPGSNVFVGTHSAMYDEERVPDPLRFDTTRAEGQYLVFGYGPHACFGERLMRRQLPALLAPLLSVDGLHRARGRAGRLRYSGPAPDGFRVTLTSPRSAS